MSPSSSSGLPNWANPLRDKVKRSLTRRRFWIHLGWSRMSSPMQRFPLLSNTLDDGRAIVVGVNADEIWHGENTAANPTGRANHALLITGIDEARGLVTLSDPGHPDGNNKEVPLDVFKEAWADGENQLLVTDQPVTHDGVTTPGPVVVPVTLNANAPTTEFALAAGFDGGGSGDTHVVQRGETLWGIARSVYGDPTAYTKIAAANGISDPNAIVTGQHLIIPGCGGANPPELSNRSGMRGRSRRAGRSPPPPTAAAGAGPISNNRRAGGITRTVPRTNRRPSPVSPIADAVSSPAPAAAAATTSSAPPAASDVASGKGDGGGTPATSSDVPAASAAPHADPPPPARSISDPMTAASR